MKKVRWGRLEILWWEVLRKQCNIGIHLWWGGKEVSLTLYVGPIKMDIRWKKKLDICSIDGLERLVVNLRKLNGGEKGG